ncbi:hypothetical protein Hanom_Chr12g01087471 [Helianthus anomalus]
MCKEKSATKNEEFNILHLRTSVCEEIGVFVFLKKLFLTTFVCAKKTKGRHRGLQCVCFSEDILLRKCLRVLFLEKTWTRHFKPLLKTHLHILYHSSSFSKPSPQTTFLPVATSCTSATISHLRHQPHLRHPSHHQSHPLHSHTTTTPGITCTVASRHQSPSSVPTVVPSLRRPLSHSTTLSFSPPSVSLFTIKVGCGWLWWVVVVYGYGGFWWFTVVLVGDGCGGL